MNPQERQHLYRTNRQTLALIELDLVYIRDYAGIPPEKGDDFVLVVAHKTRVEARGVPTPLRLASVAWLQQNGHDRMYGQPWPPVVPLP